MFCIQNAVGLANQLACCCNIVPILVVPILVLVTSFLSCVAAWHLLLTLQALLGCLPPVSETAAECSNSNLMCFQALCPTISYVSSPRQWNCWSITGALLVMVANVAYVHVIQGAVGVLLRACLQGPVCLPFLGPNWCAGQEAGLLVNLLGHMRQRMTGSS